MFHGPLTPPVAQGLRALRSRIAAARLPSSRLDESITLATWNIREFGRKRRLKPSLHYIAEIIGQFDLVSIVELRDDMRDLGEVLRYLGPSWDVVFSDYVTNAGGNHERIGFVFDKRALTFTGLASNAQPPWKKQGQEYLPLIDWWRPPYLASFRAGSFDFVLLAAHIRWGGDDATARLPELRLLADWVKARVHERFATDKDLVVVGDFNIPSADSSLYKAITAKGLKVPRALLGIHGSDLALGKRYDQILHLPAFTHAFTNHGGVLDFYLGDHRPLFPGRSMSKRDFTYQLSDHLPLWVEINTDNAGERLDQVLVERHGPTRPSKTNATTSNTASNKSRRMIQPSALS